MDRKVVGAMLQLSGRRDGDAAFARWRPTFVLMTMLFALFLVLPGATPALAHGGDDGGDSESSQSHDSGDDHGDDGGDHESDDSGDDREGFKPDDDNGDD